jgi:hypothetical protein
VQTRTAASLHNRKQKTIEHPRTLPFCRDSTLYTYDLLIGMKAQIDSKELCKRDSLKVAGW